MFKLLYFVAMGAEVAIRAPYERQRNQTTMVEERVGREEVGGLTLLFAGMLGIPLAYVVLPWLKRWDYRWHEDTRRRAGFLGTVMMIAAVWVFYRAHADLGRNWSPTLQIREEHELVTQGIYGWIRHPMYASQWLWCLAQVLMLPNWLAGPVGFLTFVPFYIMRVRAEERMMIEQFGDAYRAYMERTGRVVPRVQR
jgi:protein-S-isoprenylcysteine O-methyltransferase Ste14